MRFWRCIYSSRDLDRLLRARKDRLLRARKDRLEFFLRRDRDRFIGDGVIFGRGILKNAFTCSGLP